MKKKFRKKYFVDFPYMCSSPFFPFCHLKTEFCAEHGEFAL